MKKYFSSIIFHFIVYARIQKILSGGSNLTSLADEGREDKKNTTSGPLSARQQNAI